MVIISHFHGDHINGLITPDNKLAFPNAEILVPAAEWKFFMDDGEMSRAPRRPHEGACSRTCARVFDAIGRKVTPYEPGKEIAPGITSVATPGHTPGHTSHIIASGNEQGVRAGRRHHVPSLFVRNPGWQCFFDQDAAMAEATRRKVYDMLVGREDAGAGLPLSVPGAGLYREERHRLSRDPGAVESDALIGTDSQHAEGRRLTAAFFLLRQRNCNCANIRRLPLIARDRSGDVQGGDVMTELTRRGCLRARPRPLPHARHRSTAPVHAAAPLAGKQATGLVPHEGRHHRGDRDLRGRAHSPLPENFVRNKSRDEVIAALQAPIMSADRFMLPFNSVVVNTGSKLVAIDTGFGPGALGDQQRLDGAGAGQPRGRRHRHQDDRRGGDLAFPRRPHQRPRHRRQAVLSERRGHGAGAGMGFLDGRRQHEPRRRRR